MLRQGIPVAIPSSLFHPLRVEEFPMRWDKVSAFLGLFTALALFGTLGFLILAAPPETEEVVHGDIVPPRSPPTKEEVKKWHGHLFKALSETHWVYESPEGELIVAIEFRLDGEGYVVVAGGVKHPCRLERFYGNMELPYDKLIIDLPKGSPLVPVGGLVVGKDKADRLSFTAHEFKRADRVRLKLETIPDFGEITEVKTVTVRQ